MELTTQSQTEVPVRRYEYDDGTAIVADLGPAVEEAAIETLEDRVLVVVEHSGQDGQFEIEVPASRVADTFIANGVLTIEVKDQ